jgi:hypothetical protein
MPTFTWVSGILMDPFSVDRHITWAIYCIAIAAVVALLVLADVMAEYHRELRSGTRHGKKWWQK